jgi:hypothetical protein
MVARPMTRVASSKWAMVIMVKGDSSRWEVL